MSVTVENHAGVVMLSDNVDGDLDEDFFVAARVRSVTTQWDEEDEMFVRITFDDGGNLERFRLSARKVAEAVWPDHKWTTPGTLLDTAERSK